MTNTKLPIVISVPHAGLTVPPEAEPFCRLSPYDIAKDGDEQAREIYAPLESMVVRFHTSEVARAIVDLNRGRQDRRKDGVVKTHTCWDIPVYDPEPPEELLTSLLDKYYEPYHQGLAATVASSAGRLAIDCHTMSDHGPPVGPDPGAERPLVCIGTGRGTTCPQSWVEMIVECFAEAFGTRPWVDIPFSGGYIVRNYGRQMPYILLELSRTADVSVTAKSQAVVTAIANIAERLPNLS